jgi:hypothetical protein
MAVESREMEGWRAESFSFSYSFSFSRSGVPPKFPSEENEYENEE